MSSNRDNPYYSFICFKHILSCIFVLFFTFQNLQGQNEIQVDVDNSSRSKYDTNYIYKYESKLVVGPCLSYRNYNIAINPISSLADSIYIPDLVWRSPSNRFWGIDFSYDKFGFTFSFASVEPKSERDLKGSSTSKSFGISYGGNRCFIETSYRTFKGFYEKNSLLYDTTLSQYYQSPNLSSQMFNLKLWYFTNHHKFAFKSCYGGLYRQLKTRASWVFSSNVHWNEFKTDSSIVPDADRKYFNNDLRVTEIVSSGISLFAGAAINFVIKRGFFVNLAYVGGPDFQTLSTSTNTQSNELRKQYINFAHDIKFATGFNLKKWYLTYTFSHEMNRFTSDYIKIRGRLNSMSFNLGYRFGVKKPNLYAKFQNTWLYDAF